MKKCIAMSLFLLTLSTVWPDSCCSSVTGSQAKPAESSKKDDAAIISEILEKMNAASQNLKTCEARFSYLFIEDPDLLDSRTLRNGIFYYKIQGDKSNLRIRFDDIKQDEFDPEEQREEYLFDGVWLTHINFKLEQVDLYQQAPEGEPIGVFELINANFPLIGFSGSQEIQNEFVVSLNTDPQDPNTLPSLILTAKKDSKFKESYEKIHFWVEKDLNMPQKVVAYTPQGDQSHVEFTYKNVNKKLKNSVFTVETPKHFRKNREELKAEPLKRN